MKKLKHLYLLFLFCVLAPCLSFGNEVVSLPSEETATQLQTLESVGASGRLVGRAGPPDIDDGETPQKVSLDYNLLTFFILSAVALGYQLVRREINKTNN